MRCNRFVLGMCVAAFATIPLSTARAILSVNADASISASKLNSTTWRYTITLNNTGGASLDAFWNAWQPGEDFLPDLPSNIQSPGGWSPEVTGAGPPFDGY